MVAIKINKGGVMSLWCV